MPRFSTVALLFALPLLPIVGMDTGRPCSLPRAEHVAIARRARYFQRVPSRRSRILVMTAASGRSGQVRIRVFHGDLLRAHALASGLEGDSAMRLVGDQQVGVEDEDAHL